MIDHIIPQQRWERIRDQIFSVLNDEFASQIYLYPGSPCIGVTFWAERSTPLDKTESGIIIISTFKADYQNKSQGSTHGTYQFVLDFMVNHKADATDPGDKLASFRLQRLMGIVRYILEHQVYFRLGFTEPFIEHTEVTKFQIYKEDRVNVVADAMSTAIAQLIYTVVSEEITTPNGGRDLERSETNVKIEETDRGFQYTVIN